MSTTTKHVQPGRINLEEVSIDPAAWMKWNIRCEEKAFEMIKNGHLLTEDSIGEELYAEVDGGGALIVRCEMWGTQLSMLFPPNSWTLK